ncbi:uncharacterized protein TRAVEDRAFT_17188 [Trametes versicolor FP-101664 SS1]|uniref:uncharacterized protein n=1 Tax=Trametes versicolor (strain FP-101664) TaxID=717944 RepID=UPI0004624562|nr:uncharacterized protein TRAVEDRAFT_17188 [Trametes versicolor FP-101664 SS1]EIW62526.1 hypothetical protein TRAVEDRAFT_17188 [Trametes versicolor FP-101664 SS1]
MDLDDYFDDDLVLDDNALAVLDQAESQFHAAQQQVVGERRAADAPPPAKPPPSKKQKKSHGNEEVEPAFVVHSVEDDEGLPEISVLGGGGSYKYPAAQRAAANVLAAQLRGNADSPSREPPPKPPEPVRNTVRAPPPAPPVRNVIVAKSASASNVSTTANAPAPSPAPSAPASSSSQLSSVQPGAGTKLVRRSTFNSIQAALVGFVPPTSNANLNGRTATSRPANAAPSVKSPNSGAPTRRVSPAVPPSQARSSVQRLPSTSQAFRPPVPPRSLAAPSNRRLSSPSVSRPHVAPPAGQPRPPPQLQPPPPSQGQSGRSLRIEIDTLRAQLADILKENAEAKKIVQEERNARYAKEGEVSILRKTMEKTTKDHLAEVARIKAARESAEAGQAQLRKEMTEERERLRTEYMFKRHELETNVRKTPWSVRIKRPENQGSLTPVSAAAQRRQAAASPQHGGPSSIFQTPSRSRIDKSLPNSPERQRRRRIVDSPPPKKPARLPGFYNAFEPSPLKTSLQFSQAAQSTQINGKGKQRVEELSFDVQNLPAEDLFFNPRPTQEDAQARSSPLSSPPQEERREGVVVPEADEQKELFAPSGSAEPVTSSPAEGDVDMKDEAKPAEPTAPAEPLVTPDWTKELQGIILTHKHRSSKQPTFQLLLNHAMPATAPLERDQEYTVQIAQLLESLGDVAHMSADEDADDIVHSVERTLSTMGRILCGVGSVATLAALLDLVKVTALFVPAFIPLALAPNGEDGVDAPPELLLLLCDVVSTHLTPIAESVDQGRSELATEALALLEVVSWYTPPDLALRLSVFVRKAGVLSALINSVQPTALLLRTMRALTLAASYRPLWKHFLSFPLTNGIQEDASASDFYRIPHIEQLASFLTDRARDGPECRPLRDAILNFITTLAVSHTDALHILLQSHALLPSIIVFLHNITSSLWEEDEAFMGDPKLITWTVDVMTRTLVLLHYLMTNADPTKINLRHKLMCPPRRFSNALWHMFTVSLGRISYAHPPEWAGAENALILDQICDMAKDALEVAVDGPELESIWAAFHVDDNVPAPRTQYAPEEDESEPASEGEAPRHGTLHSVIEID